MPESTTVQKFGALWCAFAHDSATWPMHGQYRCRTCGRRYPVPWLEDGPRPMPPAPRAAETSRVPSLRSALLPLAFLLAVLPASTLRAADVPVVQSVVPTTVQPIVPTTVQPIVQPSAGAGVAFARYIAHLETADSWTLETVEIDASLPKLEKQGRLRAIRRLLPLGRPTYQVLELAGDQTVKQQVIVRYLSAEVRAAAIPAASVAITPANYKFRYDGSVINGNSVAYVYQITPRKKRQGLIKGELWLDGETGTAVRQSGYLVKQPSISIKRVDVTRQTVLRDGRAEMRITHLRLDTRLIGRAELTIREHPCADPDRGPA
jgi:hypothetical protein